jgi:hypothetical protein
MRRLQSTDDSDEEEEVQEDGIDDEDKEEEEDPLAAMDDDEREGLIENTEAVRATLMKVSFHMYIISSTLCSCYRSRFANCPLLSSILPPLSFLHGVMPASLIPFLYDLSLAMLQLDGILRTTC